MDPAFNGAVTPMQRVSQAKRGKCNGSVKRASKNAVCLRFNLPRQLSGHLPFSSSQVDGLWVFALLHMGDLKRKHALFFHSWTLQSGPPKRKKARPMAHAQPKGAPHPGQTRMSVAKPPSRVSSAAREGLRCSRRTPCRSSRLYSICWNRSAYRADVSDTRFPP